MKKNVLFVVLMLALVLVGCAEHEHVWNEGEISKDASCTEVGEMTYTCETCKATRTEVIPAMGHSYEFEVTTPATCIEDGVETAICSRCSAKGETRSIVAAHKYDSNGECTVCHAKKDDVDKAEARIGTKYFDTLTGAIKSLKDAESKTAEIVVLKNSVKLENFSTITGSNDNSAYDITFVGNGKEKTTIDISTDLTMPPYEGNHINYIEGANLAFKDMTVVIGDGSNYQGFARAGSLEFDGCAIVGMGAHWGNGDVIFKGCEFKDNGNYSLWLYTGKNYVFENCSFISSVGKFLHPYTESPLSLTITVKNCSFENTNEAAESGKPALNIKTKVVCNVSFEGSIEFKNVATGAQRSKYFQLESNNGSIIKINGVQIYPEV